MSKSQIRKPKNQFFIVNTKHSATGAHVKTEAGTLHFRNDLIRTTDEALATASREVSPHIKVVEQENRETHGAMFVVPEMPWKKKP